MFLIISKTFSQTVETLLYLEYDVIQNGKQKTGKFYSLEGESIFYYEKGTSEKIEEQSNELEEKQNLKIELKSEFKNHGFVESSLTDHKIISSERVFNNGRYHEFIISEDLEFIKWKLIPEKKTIGNYTCLKAVGKFKGREYTVWYTTEIPNVFGPWKLHGTPGTIVQAYDAENFIRFSLKKVDFNKQALAYTYLDKAQAISCEELIKLKKRQGNEIKKQIQSKLPRGATFNITKVKNDWLEKSCN